MISCILNVSTSLVANNPDAGEADRYGTTKKKRASIDKNNESFSKYSNVESFDNFFDGWDKKTQNFILLMKETIEDE